MSGAVVMDEDWRDRKFENRLNAVFRHCRIGAVKMKADLRGLRGELFTPTGLSGQQRHSQKFNDLLIGAILRNA